MTLDDLSGTRIGHRGTIGPATGGSVHPLDHIITNIEWVGSYGHFLNLKGIGIAGCFKGLVPPASSFDQGRFNGFRSTPVYIINDGLYRLASPCLRVLLFQPVPDDHTLPNVFLNGGSIIHKAAADVAATRIELAGLVIIIRQFDEGVMHSHRDIARGWGNATDIAPGSGTYESNGRFKF